MPDILFSTPIKNIYLEKYEKHFRNLESLGWNDPIKHRLRLELISDEVNPGACVLDVGCGYGDLVPHVPTRPYVGIDIMEEFISHAASLYPQDDREFVVRDVMRWDVPSEYVVGNGVLAYYPKRDAFEIVKRMWELTSDTMILTLNTTPLREGTPSWSISDFSYWITELQVPKWKIIADYLPHDVMLVWYKNKELILNPEADNA